MQQRQKTQHSLTPPRKLPQSTLKPITLPRAEHLPLPLAADLRAEFSAQLISLGTISTLRRELNAICTEAGWADKLLARAMQLLRENEGNIGSRELEKILVWEALGRDVEDEEEELGGVDAEKREGKGKVVVKVADVAIPEKARETGLSIVRQGVDGVEVVVKRELTDGWVV